jgi:hypothetical protein
LESQGYQESTASGVVMFAKPTVNVVHTDFDKAFEPDRLFVRQEERLKIRVEEIGMLVTNSGRLLAHDPCSLSYFDDNLPFSNTVPPGQYPVLLSIASPVENPSEGVCCAAMVKFTGEPVVKWELALRPAESMDQLKGVDGMVPFAHNVESGFSCFVDFLAVKNVSGPDRESLFAEKISPSLSESHGVECGSVRIGEGGENIVVFKSGFGDGEYSDYWGYAKNGSIAALATDFFILVEEITATVRVAAQSLRHGSSIKDRQLDQVKLKVKVTELTSNEISLECDGPWSSGIKLRIVDENGNVITEFRSSRSWGDTTNFTYKLTGSLTDRTTVILTYITGERALG